MSFFTRTSDKVSTHTDVHPERLQTETFGHLGYDLSQKYLEISGHSGSSLERELVLYVINNATTLQKLTVVARDEEALSRARLDFGHINSISFFSY
ncbi:hypothetical protein AAHA92_32603 [Salvia divinorum]|uniref:FBD domain-containing protein n=1 Tax=Salvia divinorum TaxID=28513 RepID=A0ABD1FPD8_SALDI